jgi:hypothetical protein
LPVSWRISEGVVFVESYERATFAQWRAAIVAALAHSDYRPDMGVLHDQRRLMDAISIDEGTARAAFVIARGIRRWAVLAGSEVGYGMGRMGEGISGGTSTEIRAFRDPVEAEAWARGAKP